MNAEVPKYWRITVVISMVAAMFLLIGGIGSDEALAGGSIISPQIQATKSPSPQTIEKGQWSKVQLTIVGDTKQQTLPLPSAVIMAIDYSGSMKVNNAYQQASEAAKKALDLLIPGVDSVGVLRISTTSDWLIPLGPLAASSVNSYKQAIDAQTADGYTNYKEAFDKANTALGAYNAPNKFVIFFSDGEPEPDTITQQNYVYGHRYDPAALGIRYFTIGYGSNFSPLLLKEMAEATGGQFFQSTASATGLEIAFKSALDSGRNSLSAQGVEIAEFVNSQLKIRPGSLSWSSIPPTTDPSQFQTQMTSLAATFHTSRSLAVPKLNELALNQNFTLVFDVTSDNCLDGQDLDVPIDDPKSEVRWLSAGTQQKLPIPVEKIRVSPCDVHLEKDYDPATSIVTLKVRNDLPRPIYNVQVLEVTLDSFRPAEPFAPPLDHTDLLNRQIRWGIYGTNKLSIAAGKEMKFSFRLSGETTKVGPLPINYSRAGVSYQVDKRIFAIPASNPSYGTLFQDAQGGSLSQASADTLNAQMTAANFVFSVPKGTAIKKDSPSSEFGYIVEGTPQSRELKLKVTPSEVIAYSRLQDRKSFPQAYTPAGHIVPK